MPLSRVSAPALDGRRYRVSPEFGFAAAVVPLHSLEEMLGLRPASGSGVASVRKKAVRKPAPDNPNLVTQSMRDVLRVVTRIAAAGDAMPNNPLLGSICGGRGRSSVLRALRRLGRAQLVVIEKRGSMRRVIITATGQATEWGEARPGHSPYIHRRPGEAAPPRPKPARRPASRPLPAQLPPPVESPPAYRAVVVSYAKTCQMPMWADGERPGRAPTFCGEPSAADRSFCAEHVALCFKQGSSRAGFRYQDGPAHLDKRCFTGPKPGVAPRRVQVVDVAELFGDAA